MALLADVDVRPDYEVAAVIRAVVALLTWVHEPIRREGRWISDPFAGSGSTDGCRSRGRGALAKQAPGESSIAAGLPDAGAHVAVVRNSSVTTLLPAPWRVSGPRPAS
ncbi:MAG: hypothetical protein IMX02_07615 [Limnochordaceae bacterium]|nr:hypothetical protein [Limnochordaceae bacterium]